jgi:hypothetical protein
VTARTARNKGNDIGKEFCGSKRAWAVDVAAFEISHLVDRIYLFLVMKIFARL